MMMESQRYQRLIQFQPAVEAEPAAILQFQGRTLIPLFQIRLEISQKMAWPFLARRQMICK